MHWCWTGSNESDAAASRLREWVRQELPGFLTRDIDQALFTDLIGQGAVPDVRPCSSDVTQPDTVGEL